MFPIHKIHGMTCYPAVSCHRQSLVTGLSVTLDFVRRTERTSLFFSWKASKSLLSGREPGGAVDSLRLQYLQALDFSFFSSILASSAAKVGIPVPTVSRKDQRYTELVSIFILRTDHVTQTIQVARLVFLS